MAISFRLKFGKPSPEAITCLLYLEFDNSILIGFSRNVTIDFENRCTPCRLCTMCNVNAFLDVYASDLLPSWITKICTDIANADYHTEGGSHWLAIHFRLKSSSAYYFDSYGIVPLVSDIQNFIRRKCTKWDHNGRQLQGLNSDV